MIFAAMPMVSKYQKTGQGPFKSYGSAARRIVVAEKDYVICSYPTHQTYSVAVKGRSSGSIYLISV